MSIPTDYNTLEKMQNMQNMQNMLGNGLLELLKPSIKSNQKDNENIFKFKGREKINDFECIIVELTFDKDKGYNYNKRRILIDTKTGLVVKTVFYDVNDNILYTVDYNLKLDSVSDSDVEIPNLNEFNITNIE